MKQRPRSNRKPGTPKLIIRLPDLEVARSAVLNRLSSPDAQRGYRHAIDEFVEWYCSEPRLAFNKTVVVRYRSVAGDREEARRQRQFGPSLPITHADCRRRCDFDRLIDGTLREVLPLISNDSGVESTAPREVAESETAVPRSVNWKSIFVARGFPSRRIS